MSENKASKTAGLVKKNIVYDKERFEYAWDNVDVLNYMYHHNRMEKPIKTKAISVNFASDTFNGTWSFRLSKKPRAPLIVKAWYTKIDALLKGEFEIKLDLIHDCKVIWSGEEKSGEIVTTKELFPEFLSMSNRRPKSDTGKTIGVQEKSEEQKVTVRMSRIQWTISHIVIEKLIARRYNSADLIFCFHIQGLLPKK